MKLQHKLSKPLAVRVGILVSVWAAVCMSPVLAKVTFSNAGASVLLGAQTSKMRISNPAKVVGWGERSIVKSYGLAAASTWPEAYQANAVIGQMGQSGVTAGAHTNLVDSNSNAIVSLSVSAVLVRTTSNAMLFGDRTNSGAINALYRNLTAPIADSIDGAQYVRYCQNHYVFHNNGNAWNVRGWVRFNNGFTVMPLGSVIMDTLTTVSGGFDLRDTGTLILNNDLYLSGAVTLTNGGNIKGKASVTGAANTIFLGGDLTLASTTYARTLHITGDWSNSGTSGDLIIDGCGHTLNIGDRAQIFVDQNVTLTLRNMTIKTGAKSLNNPAIQLASFGSKLALDNVMFDLGADFHFPQGQIFIHDEVAVTGTSAFVYQSPKPSYITSGATWSFEQATTFSVAPSTFTDCPFTINNTYTNNAFIVLADASSALSLNGCSLQTTFTGLRLRSGMVLFDNKVAIDTTAGVDLATTGTTPIAYLGGLTIANSVVGLAWSPDSRFIATVNNSGGGSLQIFRFNGVNVPSLLRTLVPSDLPQSVAWSPDGQCIVVGGNNGTVRVYRFNGSSMPKQVGGIAPGFSVFAAVQWSPDGRYFVVADGTYVRVYRFNGASTPVQVGVTNIASGLFGVGWSPDGRSIFSVDFSNGYLNLHRFNGNTLAPAYGATKTATYPNSGAWSPDGRFVAVTNSSTVKLYRTYGSSAFVSGPSINPGFATGAVSWSPDGRFLAALSNSTSKVAVFKYPGKDVLTLLGTAEAGGVTGQTIAWSPDGNFIAMATNTSPSVLRIFRCNYVYSGQPAQGFNNGLLFGQSSLGSAYDADVQILGNATVSISGAVRDDSV